MALNDSRYNLNRRSILICSEKRTVIRMRIRLLAFLLLVPLVFASANSTSSGLSRGVISVPGNFSLPVLQKLAWDNFTCTSPACRELRAADSLKIISNEDFNNDGLTDTQIFVNDYLGLLEYPKQNSFELADWGVRANTGQWALKEAGPCGFAPDGLYRCVPLPNHYVAEKDIATPFSKGQLAGAVIALSVRGFNESALVDDGFVPRYNNSVCFRGFQLDRINSLKSIKVFYSSDSETGFTIESYVVPGDLGELPTLLPSSFAYVLSSKLFTYLFINVPNDGAYFSATLNQSYLMFCNDTFVARNYLDDVVAYVFKNPISSAELYTLAGDNEFSIRNPAHLIRFEKFEQLNVSAMNFTPQISSLQSGRVITDVEFRFTLPSSQRGEIIRTNATLLPLVYQRLDNGRFESANYSYENGDFDFIVKNYALNVDSFYLWGIPVLAWPFDRYSGGLNVSGIAIVVNCSGQVIDSAAGYRTSWCANGNSLSLVVEPTWSNLFFRLFWPFVPLLLLGLVIFLKRKFPLKLKAISNLWAISGYFFTLIAFAAQFQLILLQAVSVGHFIFTGYLILGVLVVVGYDAWKDRCRRG